MALVATTFMACGPSAPQLGKASLDDVIAAMTLEEKAHLVIGTGMAGFTGEAADALREKSWADIDPET